MLALALAVAIPTIGATTAQAAGGVAVYDQRATVDGVKYHRDNAYVAPVNLGTLSAKKAIFRVEVFSKKSTLDTPMQVCAWQKTPDGKWSGPGSNEACSPLKKGITKPGVYTFDLGIPNQWWAKNGKGSYNWSKATSAFGIMVKDGANVKNLLAYKNCGSHCHPGGSAYVLKHVPIDFRATVTFGA